MRSKLVKSEVVQLFKTTKETLRYYEQVGLLKPEIDENQYRYYDFKDLEKLRQIFFLRDLDLSIDDMQKIENKLMDKSEYMNLLQAHREALETKIQHLIEVKNSLTQLIQLEEEREEITFQLKHRDKRKMYIYESLDSEWYESAKAYYDKYVHLIQSDTYSERVFQMLYTFDELATGKKIQAMQCIEIPLSEGTFESDEQCYITLQEGLYLSVYYRFETGRFGGLPFLKRKIEQYLREEHLQMVSSQVIEIEHPELALFEGEDAMIFELQLLVEKTDT